MAKKLWKWIGFVSSALAVTAVVIAVPFIASSAFFSVYKKNNADEYEQMRYQIPANLGSKVSETAFAYPDDALRTSTNIGDNLEYQKAIEETYVFAGGNDFFSNWDNYQSFKSVVGQFEENVRWFLAAAGGDNPTGPYTSLGRFCINISKPNQTLKEINDNYDFKVRNLDPQNVVTIVGSEYANTDNIDATLDQFETDLRTFVQNSLQLRDNTANLILIKHWKIPNPNNDPKIQQYNDNVEKLNIRANRILSELTADQIPRVLLVDDEDLFLNLQYYFYDYIDSNFNLTRIGCNEVAKSIVAALKPYIATTGETWTEADWHDISATHLNATPLEWNTLESKNGLNINVTESVKTEGTQSIADLTVSFPDGGVNPGDKLKWLIEFTNPSLRIEDYSVVNDQNQITVDNIYINTASTSYSLLVYDKDGHPFNILDGNLLTTPNVTVNSTTYATTAAQTLSVAQQKFMDRFNDPTKPLVWTFVGDSIDHGANANEGFDNFEEVVEKSVKNDWKRYDDIFINAAQSSNFTRRAVDPYQIQSTITKYHPDVLSIGLGISDGVGGTSNGQTKFSNQQQYIAHMKTLIEAAKEANPNVIVVVNAINPTTGDRSLLPAMYNAYLKEAFGGADSEYSDFVIYDENVYTELNEITTNYTYTQNDDLFMYTDRLHPSGDANIIKAKNLLESLGINVENSYLTNYMLQQFTWWTGSNTTNQVQAINQVIVGNKVVPNITTWGATTPMGGTTQNNNLANVFLKYSSNSPDSERTYYLTTDYNDLTNKYFLLMENGSYNVDAWAISKTPLSAAAEYAAKTPTTEIEIPATTTTS